MPKFHTPQSIGLNKIQPKTEVMRQSVNVKKKLQQIIIINKLHITSTIECELKGKSIEGFHFEKRKHRHIHTNTRPHTERGFQMEPSPCKYHSYINLYIHIQSLTHTFTKQ